MKKCDLRAFSVSNLWPEILAKQIMSAYLLPDSSVSHLHLRQDIVDEAVLDEVKVDQLVLQLDDPADGGVKQLAEE